MMAASPGAEDSFEFMASGKNSHSVENSNMVESANDKAKKQTDFNFSSLWRKPRLSRRLLRPSTEKANYHVQLDSPRSEDFTFETPGQKKSVTKPRRSVKDRESFETMGSPHLSELDESRDVVPSIMKREGWDFGRELPEGFESKSVGSSSTKKREMNPRMFLTPTPTKTKSLQYSQTPSDPAKGFPETNDVFEVVRSGGYSKKNNSRSHPWEQPSESKQDHDAIAPQSFSRVEGQMAGSLESNRIMEDVEVYRGEYLLSDAYLSSISEDSGETYPKQRPFPERLSNIATNQSTTAEKVSSPSAPFCNSFSDRLKMFQSKEQTQSQPVSFRRNNITPQPVPKAATKPAMVSTEDSRTSIDDFTPFEEHTGEKDSRTSIDDFTPLEEHTGETEIEGKLHEAKENVAISSEQESSTVVAPAGHLESVQSPRRDSLPRTSIESRFSRTPRVQLHREAEPDIPQLSVIPSQPKSDKFFVHQSASRFGVTLGKRQNALCKRTNGNLTRLPGGERTEVTSPIEVVEDKAKPQTSPKHRKPLSQSSLQARQLSLSSYEDQDEKSLTLTPRDQSKSMSVLERSKMFERNRHSSLTTSKRVHSCEATDLRMSSIGSSFTITCDKCGSSIKAPKSKTSAVEQQPDHQVLAVSHHLDESSNREEGSMEENEAFSLDPDEDCVNSDDESTVVGSRRDTLKSAPRNLTRVVKTTPTAPINVFGIAKPSEPKKGTTQTTSTQEQKVRKVENKRKASTFSERMKMFEKSNLQATSCPSLATGVRNFRRGTHPSIKRIESNLDELPQKYVQENENNAKNDGHPCFVSVEDDFSLRDDTSGFYSSGSVLSNHRVVTHPADRTPYYVKKNRSKAETSGQTSLVSMVSRESQVAKVERRSSVYSTTLKETHNKQDNLVSRPSIGRTSDTNKREDGERVLTCDKHQSMFVCRTADVLGGKQKVSSSISNKLAMFEKKPQRKWSNSRSASMQRKSIDRSSLSDRSKSRKSSLSLQDVLDSRNDAEENRKSLQGKESTSFDTNVEMNGNVRPSHLLKKLKENVAPAPPSPLVGRRGFSSMATRRSSGRNSNVGNLRCF
jgi:hypothetical protein